MSHQAIGDAISEASKTILINPLVKGRIILEILAPSTFLIPISRARLTAIKSDRLKRPEQESRMATMAKYSIIRLKFSLSLYWASIFLSRKLYSKTRSGNILSQVLFI